MTRAYLEGSHGTASEYGTYVEERFQGEVYGEALFRTMADLCEDPERAGKLRVLQQLERETKETLLPAVREAGHPGEARPERIAEGEALGARLAKAPWNELMLGFQKELERFVREFEAAERLAPSGKEGLLRHVTAHEKALLAFATRELAGDAPGASLEPVIALLRRAPPDR
jgi:hypothetical protein